MMKSIPQCVSHPLKSSSMTNSLNRIFALLLTLVCAHGVALAQGQKLPSPDKVVADYLKAVGGKKRVAALRDATYEWVIQSADGAESRARVLTKSPSYVRSEVDAGKGESVFAVNPRMAWPRAPDFPVETLTGGEAFNARLRATLGAARLLDFKKQKVLARTVGTEQVGGEPAYVVEFSTREGGRARLWFGAASKLLLKSEDGRGGFHLYTDYRPQN